MLVFVKRYMTYSVTTGFSSIYVERVHQLQLLPGTSIHHIVSKINPNNSYLNFLTFSFFLVRPHYADVSNSWACLINMPTYLFLFSKAHPSLISLLSLVLQTVCRLGTDIYSVYFSYTCITIEEIFISTLCPLISLTASISTNVSIYISDCLAKKDIY